MCERGNPRIYENERLKRRTSQHPEVRTTLGASAVGSVSRVKGSPQKAVSSELNTDRPITMRLPCDSMLGQAPTRSARLARLSCWCDRGRSLVDVPHCGSSQLRGMCHPNSVDLRLLAVRDRARGNFRTGHRALWRWRSSVLDRAARVVGDAAPVPRIRRSSELSP